MDPRVRLSEGLTAIKDQECQRVIRIEPMLDQQRSTMVALHGNQAKGWLSLVMLHPSCPAAAEVAQAIEDHDSVFGFHYQDCSIGRLVHAVPENCATQPTTSIRT
jgi:hypothetical protein